ncbi:reverse transcriptase domain-containing protein, partial [Acinetobacter baumannii]|uniref:reverse transcriptase domain-containing protein n=1 Tax=Acinetobacter baumannii TaxID=470 RepID=UPI003394833E
HVYKQPTIAVFLDFKGAFDSVDRQVLLDTLARKGMPTKYVNIIRALYAQTSGQVRVYGELSASFPMVSGVRQGGPLSPFLFNFVIDEIMEECLNDTTESGVQVLPGDRLIDLDYADDIVF